MKSSTLTPDNALHDAAAQFEQPLPGSAIGRLPRAIYAWLNQIGTAIAIGESGDLEAAHAWREHHGAN